MPIYEYQCHSCGHRLEVMQKISDQPLQQCPQCGTLKLQKCISAPNFHLKGTGWYVTDFRNKNNESNKATKQDTGTEQSSKDSASKTQQNTEKTGTTTE